MKNQNNNIETITQNINKTNEIIEQQKLRDNLKNKNIEQQKKIIINSKINNKKKYIYNNEVPRNTDEIKINSTVNSNNVTPKKEYEIRRESDIYYKIKPNNNKNNFVKNNEINREVSLDYSLLSSDKKSKSRSKSNETTNKKEKKEIFELSNENDFTIIKSKIPKNKKSNRKSKIVKKNNIITNININNFGDKKEFPEKNKLVKKDKKKIKSKDKSEKKEKLKPKYNFRINLKDLINEEIREKSKISPDKRYAEIEMKRRAINKKEEENKYNKPFKFNMNDDY